MVKNKVASKIAEEWFKAKGDFDFTMDELTGVGFDVKSEDDAKNLSLEIKVEVFKKMYKLVIDEIYG
jgi:hypothetical protein|tara:strand:+ start:663 stop:863 length:201 start_codon:yes stop_codon:yes gene_type:complete